MWATLHWRHNGHDWVSNHQPHDCLLNQLFRRRSKRTSKLCVNGLCAGNSPGPVNSLHKWPVMWKMFPFDDVIMNHGLVSSGIYASHSVCVCVTGQHGRRVFIAECFTLYIYIYAWLHQMLRWEPQHGSGPSTEMVPVDVIRHQSGVALGLAP